MVFHSLSLGLNNLSSTGGSRGVLSDTFSYVAELRVKVCPLHSTTLSSRSNASLSHTLAPSLLVSSVTTYDMSAITYVLHTAHSHYTHSLSTTSYTHSAFILCTLSTAPRQSRFTSSTVITCVACLRRAFSSLYNSLSYNRNTYVYICILSTSKSDYIQFVL